MRRITNFALFLSGIAAWTVLCQAQSTPRFTISTIAGNGTGGFAGDGGPATGAELADPDGVAVDSTGAVYIADTQNQRVRKVAGGAISTFAGDGQTGFAGDGGKATSGALSDPENVAVDAAGNVYIADSDNSVIRMVSNGVLSTVAGNEAAGGGYSGDFGPATSAQLFHPSGVAVDSAGNLYIADTSNNIVRVVTNGIITTAAGDGVKGHAGDGGQATEAQLNNPVGIAVDSAGNLYIADSLNNRVRKVTVATGAITTLAGNGTAGYSGDGGRAATAELNNPQGVAVDAAGNVYIADEFNERIRVVTPNGNIATVAGGATGGFAGDGGPATGAELFFPSDVAVDAAGNVYVADRQNNRIRMLTLIPQPPAINAGGVVSAAAFGGFSAVSPGSWIEIYGSNLAADTRPWGGSDFSGNNAPTGLDGTSVTIGGQAAFVSYISGAQVNAQVPSNTGTGSQSLTVTTKNGTSAAYSITVNALEPGLLATSTFNVGGNQYVAAVLPDGNYALPAGAISGVASRPAFPGENVTLYGVGFGPVTPNIPAGQIVQQSNTLASPFQILFGSAAATVTYSGLAPGEVGLYQFNVTVPNVAANNLVPLTFNLGSASGSQTLYIAVQN